MARGYAVKDNKENKILLVSEDFEAADIFETIPLSQDSVLCISGSDDRTRRIEDLERKLKEAESANIAKEVFLSNMSHDIRTPMNAIIGMTGLARKNIDEKAKLLDSLNKIDTASRHLLTLINEVLDMSHIDSGKMVLSDDLFYLSELLHDTLVIIRPQAENKNDKYLLLREAVAKYEKDGKWYKVYDKNRKVADILFEALNQARVMQAGLNVPKLEEVCVIDGQWAIVQEYIEGKTIKQLMEEEPEKEDEYLRWFVELQNEMHKLRIPKMSKHNDKMNGKIAHTELSATLRYDLHTRVEAMPKHYCVLHGDYKPNNVIIDKNGKPYIIDWYHATQGNAEADAARSYMMFLVDGNKARARKYIDLFAEISGCKIKDVLSWLPILAASQSVKGIKNQSAFLTSLIFMEEKELEKLYEEL